MAEIIKKEIRNRNNLFCFLVAGIALAAGLYVYLVSHTVYTAVERQKAERTIAAIDAGFEKLEAEYLSLKGKVTLDLARAKGFKDVASTKYLSRHLPTLSLNNEI